MWRRDDNQSCGNSLGMEETARFGGSLGRSKGGGGGLDWFGAGERDGLVPIDFYMKKSNQNPHWQELPSDDMFELISDLAHIFCWYIFWAKGLPEKDSDPNSIGWEWARNNAKHQPDQFFVELLSFAWDQPMPLRKAAKMSDLLEVSSCDIGNLQEAVSMALEWFDAEVDTSREQLGKVREDDDSWSFIKVSPVENPVSV